MNSLMCTCQVHLQRCFLLAGVYAIEKARICRRKRRRGRAFLTTQRQREYYKQNIYHKLSESVHLVFVEYSVTRVLCNSSAACLNFRLRDGEEVIGSRYIKLPFIGGHLGDIGPAIIGVCVCL